jgi:Fe-S cluster assembly iron-binding protein IscA
MGGEGCGGFSYKFEAQEITLVEDEDFVLEYQEKKYVVVDSESIVLLNGVEIDFENEIARTGYTVRFYLLGLGFVKSF